MSSPVARDAGAASGVRIAVLALVVTLGACANGPPPDMSDGAADTRAPTEPSEGAPSAPIAALDADRDGVADAVDDCPDSAPGEIVGGAGCPLFTRVLEGVVFAPNDHRLGAASRLALAALASDLETHPGVVLRLEGHTDNRGTAAANLELSKRRVMSVARFLVARGIAPARLRPYGFGESRPRAGNATAPGRERNRRIEIGLEGLADPPPGVLAEPDAARQNGENPGKQS